MGEKIKSMFYHLLRLEFWSILFFETTIVGLVLLYIDYMYDDQIVPFMLWSLNFPYFGLIMLIGGIYSIIRLFIRIDLASVIINAIIWIYVAVASIVQLITSSTRYDLAFNSILLVLSLALSIRILANSYYLDLYKEKINSKEISNGQVD